MSKLRHTLTSARQTRGIFALTGVLIILDQVTKNSALNTLTNPGLALGYGQWAVRFEVLVIWSMVVWGVLLLLGRYLVNWHRQVSVVAWVLVASGGLSNLLDRWLWGGVIDWWSFFGWWSNNLADWLIALGVTVFVIERLYTRVESAKT